MADMTMEEKYEFRSIRSEEGEEAAYVEAVCFPPNEACSKKDMMIRAEQAQDEFLVAIDKEIGKIAGFLNGLPTNETVFRDEFFTDITLRDPDGKNVMLLGLDVMPDYRMQGLARELVRRYADRERAKGRDALLLTCLEDKVEMYKKFGFTDHGWSASAWGGERWHEMKLDLA